MPYKITLTLVGGERIQLPEVHQESTPKVGDKITVSVRNGSTRAEVTRVSPGTVNDVEAQER